MMLLKRIFKKAYELVPEAYRQKFRQAKKREFETYVEFPRQKETLFDRWCTSKTSTGTSGLLEGVGGFAEAPLHRVNLRSDLVSGSVIVGVQSVEGIYFIIGNDLAGAKVLADPKVVEKPRGIGKGNSRYFSRVSLGLCRNVPPKESFQILVTRSIWRIHLCVSWMMAV